MSLTPAGSTFLVITSAVLPLLALRSAWRLGGSATRPTRVQYAISLVVTQGMTLMLALSAARYESISLFPPPRFGLAQFGMAAAFLIPALGTLPSRWSWKTRREKESLLWLLPHSVTDLGWWAIVALAAGIIEEIVYRGVMFSLWRSVLGPGAAVAVCVVVFALAHAVQGWRAMLVIALMAAGAHIIVLATGDLYTAMGVHVLYDFAAGGVLLQLARRERLLPAAP